MSEQLELFTLAPYTRDETDDMAPCHVCGNPTAPSHGPSEWYMIRNELWSVAGVGHGYLCIGCLEDRLGRRLGREDFSGTPINDPTFGWKTGRLMARLLVPWDATAGVLEP